MIVSKEIYYVYVKQTIIIYGLSTLAQLKPITILTVMCDFSLFDPYRKGISHK